MGFFKDLNKLNKQANEMSKGYDPAAQMRAGTEQMKQMNESMALQQLATTGEPVSVQITSSRDTGTVLNMQPVIEMTLLVTPEGGAPSVVTVSQIVPMSSMAKVVPGTILKGKIDPANPDAVWINWAGY